MVATPAYLDSKTGKTAPLIASLQITQGTSTSNSVQIAIADLPASSTYGQSPGAISRAFINAQEIYFGLTINALQAMRKLPTSKTNTNTVQQRLTKQLTSTIESRANIDLIITGSQKSLLLGTAKDGSAIAFDSNSVDVMDRIIAMYLQSVGYLSSSIYPAVKANNAVSKQQVASSASAAVPVARPLNVPQAITGLGTVSGAVGVTNNAIQANGAANSHNGTDAIIAIGQGVTTAAITIGTLAIAVAGAPEVVALATIMGTMFAVGSVVNDAFKWNAASNAVDAALANGDAAALATAEQNLTYAKANTAIDAVGAALGIFGFPASVAEAGGLGEAVVNALKVAQETPTGVAVQGLSLIDNLAGLYSTATAPSEASADSQSMTSSNAEVPVGANSFGLVDGTLNISNANNPDLWPLAGVSLTDPGSNTAFTTMADSGGDYSLIVPLGVPGLDYPQMSLQPFDPISDVPLAPSTSINLSGLTATSPLTVKPVAGTCVDTDAADPDSDDPDCD
ncbi:hypothetical protein CR51_31215 [Caballeronia megalochromosomata]|nr:hypothetical protein CR51_31215 [Caballeronia megalochromosomata]